MNEIYTYEHQTFVRYQGEDLERLTGLFEDTADEMAVADTLIALHYDPEPFMLLGDCCSDCYLCVYGSEIRIFPYLALVTLDGTGMAVLLSTLPEVFALIRELAPAIDLAAKTAMLEEDEAYDQSFDPPGAAWSPNGQSAQARFEPGVVPRDVIEQRNNESAAGPLAAMKPPMMPLPSRPDGSEMAGPPGEGDVLAAE